MENIFLYEIHKNINLPFELVLIINDFLKIKCRKRINAFYLKGV